MIWAWLGPHYTGSYPDAVYEKQITRPSTRGGIAYVSLRELTWLSDTVREGRGSRSGRHDAHCLIG